MNVDKAEDDCTQNADTEKCEDDDNLLVIDIISECILSRNMSGKSVVGRRGGEGGGGGGGGGGDVGEQVITDQLQVSERFPTITRDQGAQYQEEKSRSAVSEVIVLCWHGRDSW